MNTIKYFGKDRTILAQIKLVGLNKDDIIANAPVGTAVILICSKGSERWIIPGE